MMTHSFLTHAVRTVLLSLALILLSPPAAVSQFQDKEAIAPEAPSGLQRKKLARAEKFMVSAAHPEATRAGLAVLRRGGNALDAAIAVQLALGVVEPQSSGIGGGGFLLYYDAKQKKIFAYDGRETAPQGVTAGMFLDERGQPQEFYSALIGGRSVGVPGIIALLKTAHAEHGRLAWRELFTEAVALADKGFTLSPRLYEAIRTTPNLNTFPATRAYLFAADGVTPKPVGTMLRNPELAQTLRYIALDGGKSFYSGEIAADIIAAVRGASRNPGTLTKMNLKAYAARKREPLCLNYRTVFDVCGFPPPTSGGVTTLAILGILENFDLTSLSYADPEFLHLFTQASRLAYADRDRYLADPDFVTVPARELLTDDYLAARAALISRAKDGGTAEPGEPVKKAARLADDASPELPGTSHFVVVDKDGNVVSFTTSVENAFGSTLFVRGFFLNNQLTDFSFLPEVNGMPVANRIAPGKRPRSSMAPTIVLNHADRSFLLALGSPGGPRIIDYVAKALVAILDFKLDMQAAIDLPNVTNRNGPTDLEKGTRLESLAAPLTKLGHSVNAIDLNSGLHGVMRTASGLEGGADPRREGLAAGE